MIDDGTKQTFERVLPRPRIPDGDYLVVGLAKSGQAAAQLLASRGATVYGADSGRPAGSDTLGDFGVDAHLESDGVDLLDRVRTVIKSPGVPNEAPAIAQARAGGLTVIGELELGWRMLENPVIAVTGTNGKTTTTELLGAIYRQAGLPVEVAGNVGTPLCSLVGNVPPETMIVCEASSYQLEDADGFTPECGVLLNLAPDHIDRHGDFASYRAAKLRMFEHQGPGQFAVIGPSLGDLEIPGDARKYPLHSFEFPGDNRTIAMQGPHNKENALIAAMAALLMGVDPEAIDAALATFGGLEHRMELVGEVAGVRYVNDSKATNVHASLAALAGFDGDLRLIIGGSGKGEDMSDLRGAVEAASAAVYLNGETAGELAAALDGIAAPVSRHETLEQAFSAAAADAQPGETVLLTPAAASFDQFANYEARGAAFKQLVAALQA